MYIEGFHESESGTWTYLLADEQVGVAAIIDPVWVYDPVSGQVNRAFIDGVLEDARSRGWRIEWVLETHAHADHLSCGALIRSETGARIAIGRGICQVQESFSKVYNAPALRTDGSQFDRLLSEGDEIHLGDLTIWVMETPGHTSDSLTYLVKDVAFIGDTLFAPSFGSARCDFPGGDAARLFDSVQRIYGLPDETRLYLCHDYPKPGAEPLMSVTVADSRRENVHVSADTRRNAFVRMREARDSGLALPRLILPALQVNIRGGQAPAPESNGHSYLKIPFDTTIASLLEE